MPDVTFRGAASGTGSGGTATVNQPASTVIGDLLLAALYHSTTTGTPPTTPAGWTLIGTAGSKLWLYWRYAVANGAAAHSFTTGGGSWETRCSVYYNVSPTTPIHASAFAASAVSLVGLNGTVTCPSVTTTLARCEIVTGFGFGTSGGYPGGTWVPPSGETLRYGTGFSDQWVSADELQTSTGATGTKAYTITFAGSGTYSSIGEWTVALTPNNQAPNAPSLDAPANASYQDAAAGLTVSWTHSDPNGEGQSAYAMRRKISGAGSYEYWNAGTSSWQGSIVWNTTGSQSVVFGSGKWTNGNIYNWSVATQDNNATPAQGPFASDLTFTAQTPPSVSVTAPTGTQGDTQPTVVWADTLPGGVSQTAYRLVVESGAYGTTPGSGTTAWDSGVTVGAVLQRQIGTPLVNGVTYRAFVQVTETGGQTSAWGYTTFTVTLNPPAAPTIGVTWDGTLARNVITLQGHDNLLTSNQASLEMDTTGWVAGANTTIARSTAQAVDGVASLSLTATAAAGISATTPTGVSGIAVVVGQTYTALASLRPNTTARTCTVAIGWYTAAGALISTSTGSGATDTAATWTQVAVTAVAPATAAFASVVVSVASPGAGEIHYVDRISLANGSSTTWTRGGLLGVSLAEVECSDDGGATWSMVRGGTDAVMSSSQTLTLYDYEVPPNQTRSYRARVMATV